MANPLNMDLTDKKVLLKQSAFDEPLSESERTVKVTGGFGAVMQEHCLSYGGGALYVEFANGSSGAFRGMDIEKLVE